MPQTIDPSDPQGSQPCKRLEPCECTDWCGSDVRVYLGSVSACGTLERWRLARALESSARHIAERAVISDIESDGIAVEFDGVRYYDIRPLVDLREVPGELLDMASEALAYALGAGIFEAHPVHPYLLRKVAR